MMDMILDRLTMRNLGKSYRKLAKCALWCVYDVVLLAPVVGVCYVGWHFAAKLW